MATFNAWDHDFLWLAQQWGNRKSKDPSTRVGAVIANGKKIISLGYNGFPAGLEDDWRFLEDRTIKLERTVHAEINAILFAGSRAEGATLYTAPFPPCLHCAPVIINAGIRRIVSFPAIPRWAESCDKACAMFAEAGIEQWIVGDGVPHWIDPETALQNRPVPRTNAPRQEHGPAVDPTILGGGQLLADD